MARSVLLARLVTGALLVALVGGGVSCGPSAGLHGQVYRGEGLAFRVGVVPREWRPLQTDALLAYRDEPGQATVAINGRCGQDGDDVPLTALTQHLFLHFTDRQPVSERAFMLDGREALRTELTARLDGVEQRFVVVVLKKDGCVYDFLLVQAVGGPAAARERFDAFVGAFATVSQAGERASRAVAWGGPR